MLSRLSFDTITTDDISFLFADRQTEVHVLRLDKLHPIISGNKWFKLRYYLEEALALGKTGIITFGGAWSNHIVAAAAACRSLGLRATGIIRGKRPAILSSTLREAERWGMQLVFITRAEYRDKYIPPALLTPDDYTIPEGGYGLPGARGAAAITGEAPGDYTHYCCAAGTGTMMAGLIMAGQPSRQVIGIPVLKNKTELEKNIAQLLPASLQHRVATPGWQLIDEYHFGGYAKCNASLTGFMNDFYRQTGIPSDFVYTGKLFYGITELIRNGFFAPGSRLLIVHSGGLQGNASLPKGMLIF